MPSPMTKHEPYIKKLFGDTRRALFGERFGNSFSTFEIGQKTDFVTEHFTNKMVMGWQ